MLPAYVYRAKCTRVIDGDTFVAQVDLGFFASIQIRVRLQAVWAPELREEGGPEARDFLAALILDKLILVRSFRDVRSFERWVCDAWCDGESVADTIVAAGHARV